MGASEAVTLDDGIVALLERRGLMEDASTILRQGRVMELVSFVRAAELAEKAGCFSGRFADPELIASIPVGAPY